MPVEEMPTRHRHVPLPSLLAPDARLAVVAGERIALGVAWCHQPRQDALRETRAAPGALRGLRCGAGAHHVPRCRSVKPLPERAGWRLFRFRADPRDPSRGWPYIRDAPPRQKRADIGVGFGLRPHGCDGQKSKQHGSGGAGALPRPPRLRPPVHGWRTQRNPMDPSGKSPINRLK